MQDLNSLLENLSHRTTNIDAESRSRLEETVAALAEFAASLYPEGKFTKQGNRWVFTPQNFVTFQPLKTRDEVVLTLRGNPIEFLVFQELPLAEYRHQSYSSCVVTSPHQLMAASSYIHRAYQLFRRGRNRIRRRLTITECEL
jgi:hypothetical protein